MPSPGNSPAPRPIHILPDAVASRIAAGEVVERPVAVVKELVENSLDAGAAHIFVDFAGGGVRKIVVEDDGSGMNRDNALLSLERHATSKLADAGDLDHIASFGFRGEALPSIASVAHFSMKTRDAASEVGTLVEVAGGLVKNVRETGASKGTRIEVADLFYNVPARLKFLKSEKTEAAHIVLATRLLALANPSVAFTLSSEGRTLFSSPACESLARRADEVFGRGTASGMAELAASGDGIALCGLLLSPGAGRPSRTDLFYFANRRSVENRLLLSATLEAAEGFFPRDRFPAGFLFLEIDPAAIDVNVHPAKREIRLRDEAKVRDFVLAALREKLGELSRGKSAQIAAPRPAAVPAPAIAPGAAPVRHAAPILPPAPVKAGILREVAEPPAPPASKPRAIHPAAAPGPHTIPDGLPQLPSWRYVGTLSGGLVLFETAEGLLVLGASAARARIAYERCLETLEKAEPVTQGLLFPLVVELSPAAAGALEGGLPLLRRGGFDIEPFGRGSFRLSGVPAWFPVEAADEFVKSAADSFAEGGLRGARDPLQARDTFARIAATHAGRGPAPADEAQALDLAGRLLSCKNPLADARGRAAITLFTHRELTGQPLQRAFL
jgi:DNA mismatch repair protein MutL